MIIPSWDAPKTVRAASTIRAGGVSTARYASFNLGDHVEDDSSHVEQNRINLVDQLKLPNSPLWLNQVHGTEVIENTSGMGRSTQASITADASWANEPGRVCVVMTADCLPILLCSKQGDKVAAIHAGWRGLAAGIIEKTVARMNAEPHSLLAWLGPHIGFKHFEVGLEVQAALGGPDSAYREHHEAQKVYADLSRVAAHRLECIGVDQVVSAQMCTFSNPDQFYSFRRDGQCGRMATLIWISDDVGK